MLQFLSQQLSAPVTNVRLADVRKYFISAFQICHQLGQKDPKEISIQISSEMQYIRITASLIQKDNNNKDNSTKKTTTNTTKDKMQQSEQEQYSTAFTLVHFIDG